MYQQVKIQYFNLYTLFIYISFHFTVSASINCYSCEGDSCDSGVGQKQECARQVFQCYEAKMVSSSSPNIQKLRRGCLDILNPCALSFPDSILNTNGGVQSSSQSCSFTTCTENYCNSSVKIVSSFVLLIACFICTRFQ